METILLTILPRLGLSVVGSFNNFLKILQFSQSVLERLASVCHLHCTVSRLRWRKERIHLKPGLALSERPVKYSLTWPLFNITNQIIILQKMMWWKASTLKKRIFLFLFFSGDCVDYLLTTLALGSNLLVNAGVLFTIVLCSRLFTLHTMTRRELAVV